MSNRKVALTFQRSAIAGSLLVTFGTAVAQGDKPTPEDIRRDLATPESRVEAGIGFLSGESRRFGEYNGLNSDGAYGLLNLNLIKRDDATGTWLKLKASNLGLETREFRLEHERQGDWSYFLDVGSLVRNEPWVVRTGLSGIGTGTQVVSGAAGKRDVDFRIERDTVGLGARKYFAGGFDVRVSFKEEKKEGNRMYGRVGHDFLAEPLDRITRQWEVVAGYADRKLQLSGGYSGSSFENQIPLLAASGGAGSAAALAPVLALPPSNEAHQVHLAGGYNFSDTTRTSLKFSHTLALQDSDISMPAGTALLATRRPSLGGRVVTTLAFADLTLKPADRLDLTANVRFEDRDDQTAIAQYITFAGPSAPPSEQIAGITGFNKPRSLRQLKGSLEAGYQLENGLRLVGTLEQEQVARNIPFGNLRVGYRQKNDETLARLEIKGSVSDTLNGALAYIHSDRGGSDYVSDNYSVTAAAPTNLIHPLMWADRRRDKLRLTADWLPEEAWSVQFIGDLSSDQYNGRTLGPREGTARFLSGDITYAINNSWKLSGWVSQERTTADQTTHTNFDTTVPATNPPAVQGVYWEAKLRNITTAWGISLKGKPRDNLELVADLSSSTDLSEHAMARLGNIGGGVGTASPTSLPEYFYRQLSLKLSADYTLDRSSGLRGMFVYDHRRTNDWSWAGWVYNAGAGAANDGTTVSQPNQQNTSFLGAVYYYRWR